MKMSDNESGSENQDQCNFSIQINTKGLRVKNDAEDMYVCRNCKQSFSNIIEYLCHTLISHLSNWGFHCKICQTTITDVNAIKHHAKLHLHNEIIVIELSNRKEPVDKHETVNASDDDGVVNNQWDSFSEESEDKVVLSKLKSSIKGGKRKKAIKCEQCPRTFSYKSAYDKHLKAHGHLENSESFLCDNCGRQCPNRHAYTEHRRRNICGIFVCPNCFHTFSELKSLKLHYRETHSGRLLKCRYCVQVIDETKIEEHYTDTHADKPKWNRTDFFVECEICKKKMRNKGLLERHVRKHLSAQSGEQSFLCMYCGKTFTLDSSLKIHLRIHNNDFRYRCDVCGEGFVTKGYLKRHFFKHSGEKNYKCTLCTESFNYRRAFQQHRLVVHQQEAQYKCDTCGANYESKSRFLRHKKVYAGNCAPVCRYCNVKVPRGILKRHELTHTDTKLFACTLCPKRFTRRENFEQHQNIHTGERPYKCTECDQAFHIYATLFAHRMKHEGKKYKKSPDKIVIQCTECTYTCSSRLILNSHLLKKHGMGSNVEEVFQCAQCDYRSNKRANVYAHRRKYHGNKKWDCTYCGKSFTIKFKYLDHLNCHTGAAPHQCPGCPKTFSQRKNMWQHRDKYCPVVSKRKKLLD